MAQPDSKIRVLLADDHAVVREGIRHFLQRAGDIEVVAEADDGAQAQALVEQVRPDVAVLDIQMPKMSGIELTRWIRAHCPETGVLVLTAYNDDPYIVAVLQSGANGFVLKTASPLDIIRAVREVYVGKSAIDASAAQKLVNYISKQATQADKEPLTDREMEVLRLAARGLTNRAMAQALGISDRTVQGHLAHIFYKMSAKTRTEAVMRAVSLGWVTQSEGVNE